MYVIINNEIKNKDIKEMCVLEGTKCRDMDAFSRYREPPARKCE